MSFKDAFKNFIGIPEDDFYEEDDMDVMPNAERDMGSTSSIPGYSAISSENKKNKVVNIHATTQLQVVLVKPEHFEDATSIADHLNEKRTVVLNMEQTKPEVSRRLLDFLCGVAYANNGQVKRVASRTYIITPYNVGILGDLLDELENSGVIF